MRRIFSGIICLPFFLSSCATLEQNNLSRLDLIKKRDELRCGVSGKIPGFSFINSRGSYEGLDVDICKAFAAAILGDSSKVEYRPLTAAERFTAIKTGEIDLWVVESKEATCYIPNVEGEILSVSLGEGVVVPD